MIGADSRTLAYRLFKAIPASPFGFRLMHGISALPAWTWPRGLDITRFECLRADDQTWLSIYVLRPSTVVGPLPIVVQCHGGGFVAGRPAQEFHGIAGLLTIRAAVVVVPAYRLSFEQPYPAALDDCAMALEWAMTHAEQIGGDRSRVHVMGSSAGGGLAAALTLRMRHHPRIRLRSQILFSPMLDNRTTTAATGNDRQLTWCAAKNRLAWHLYLRGVPSSAGLPPEAVPALASDLTGVPPAFGVVGHRDLFLGETVAYMARMVAQGIAAKVSVIPGAYHGIEVLAPQSEAGRALIAAQRSVFDAALGLE